MPWPFSRAAAASGSVSASSSRSGGVDGSYQRPPEFDRNYIDEDAIAVFERALNSTEENAAVGDEPVVEHIRSVSDFAPIRERVRREAGSANGANASSSSGSTSSSRKKRRGDVVREGWAYHVSRWPLLLFIFGLIGLEFLTYVLVRQFVNVLELFSGWRGKMGQLRLMLRRAKTFEDWRATALQLDELLGYETWKRTPANAYYDSGLVRRVTENLRKMREADDAEGVSAVLEVCLRSNFAGMESSRMYSETYYGTKDRIRAYIEEVERCIGYVRKTEVLTLEAKARLFRYVTKNNGSTALCLSGGASFGYYHFGVVRALLDAGLLPKVITGTSAGALVAALVCTHTDEELRRLLIPQLAEKLTACDEPITVWAKRLYRTGARFDTVQWARKSSFWTNGTTTTFREAYERTGRILNVSVIPYDTHSPTKLLNVHTAPDCIILTAIIASAAVPGILNPVVLMTKDKRGKVMPWQFQGRHKDGSLRVDIPLQSLNLYFNVTYSIISQVNPHIHLFFFQPRGAPGKPVNHRKGKGWRGGFFLSAAEQFLKLDLTKNFRVIRDLELMPELLGQNWSGVFLQKFEGSVTIWPKSRIKDWTRLLSDPDEAELARMMRVGQLVTWPKLHMIENRMRIERQIDAGRAECRAAYSARANNAPSGGAAQYAGHFSSTPGALSDSSALDEDSDSDIDLGGPEANAPLPDNDETIHDEEDDDGEGGKELQPPSRPTASARHSNASSSNGSRVHFPPEVATHSDETGAEDDAQADARERAWRTRRAGSAPASPSASGSASAIRKRRRQIMSSLGLSAQPERASSAGPMSGSGDRDRLDFLAPSMRHAGGNSDFGLDTPGTEGMGLSSSRVALGDSMARRRLSTGQLWLGRRNKVEARGNAFGSGVSDDEGDALFTGDELESEKSFDRRR